MKFRDKLGREWAVSISGGDAIRIEKELGIDVTSAAKAIEQVYRSGPVFLNVLSMVVRDAVGNRPTDPIAFGDGFNQQTIEAAQLAFEAGLDDFFQGTATGRNLRQLLNKGRAVNQIAEKKMGLELEMIDPEKIAESLFRKSSGSSVDRPASTPEQ